LREGDPIATSAMVVNVSLELGILLRGPRALLHIGLVTTRGSSHVCVVEEKEKCFEVF